MTGPPAEPRIVASLRDLDPGRMKCVELDGKPIALIRLGNRVCAIAGTCPHAGGPLAEGVLDGETVICPWHKAAFDVPTGRCAEPPAVDDLATYPVQILDGKIALGTAREPLRSAANPVSDRRTFVILGSGAAGTAAARTLRMRGFGGRVLMISQEELLPYDRTVLSKYTLSGTEGGEKSPLHRAEFYRENAIERIVGKVDWLSTLDRTVSLTDGTRHQYDTALIATGGTPIQPDFPGSELMNVFLLRTPADAQRIVAAAGRSRKAVLIGTGFIGMEAAASLRERGLEVTVVGSDRLPFQKQLGTEIGAAFLQLHEQKGVRFKLGTAVARLEGSSTVERVVLSDGTVLPADFVVAGLGIEPETGFVRDLPLDRQGAIEVDAQLRAGDHLYAAGDIAAFPLHGTGKRIRVEHWRVAEQHGRTAAWNMIGHDQPFTGVLYFWTIHFKKRLDYVGHATSEDQISIRGDASRLGFIAYFERDGRVTAAAGMGRDQDMAAVLALMNHRQDWTLDTLHPEGSTPCEVLARRSR